MFYLRAWDHADAEDATPVQAGSARLQATRPAKSKYARDISLAELPRLHMIAIYQSQARRQRVPTGPSRGF